jgi:hypothetical protein
MENARQGGDQREDVLRVVRDRLCALIAKIEPDKENT